MYLKNKCKNKTWLIWLSLVCSAHAQLFFFCTKSTAKSCCDFTYVQCDRESKPVHASRRPRAFHTDFRPSQNKILSLLYVFLFYDLRFNHQILRIKDYVQPCSIKNKTKKHVDRYARSGVLSSSTHADTHAQANYTHAISIGFAQCELHLKSCLNVMFFQSVRQ